MIVERFSKRQVYSCGNRQMFFKPGFGGARRRDLCPIRWMGSRIPPKTGKEKTSRKKKSAKLATEISRGGRQLFKTAKLPRYWQKSHALAKNFKNKIIKRCRARGRKRMRGKNRSGKGDWKPRSEGKTDTKWIIVERVFLKNTCEKAVITV